MKLINLADKKAVKNTYVCVRKISSFDEAKRIEKYIKKHYPTAIPHESNMFNIDPINYPRFNIFFFYCSGKPPYYGICNERSVNMNTLFTIPEGKHSRIVKFARILYDT